MPIMDAAPAELAACIREFWPEEEWENAAAIAREESGFNAFAVNDTTSRTSPCGTPLDTEPPSVAEFSIGYFQINWCNFQSWDWHRLYNARHNAGTAHMLWDNAGGRWTPWLNSAKRLGLPF